MILVYFDKVKFEINTGDAKPVKSSSILSTRKYRQYGG